jgi:hypothetical protein
MNLSSVSMIRPRFVWSKWMQAAVFLFVAALLYFIFVSLPAGSIELRSGFQLLWFAFKIPVMYTLSGVLAGKGNNVVSRYLAKLFKRDAQTGFFGMPIVFGIMLVSTYLLDFVATDDTSVRELPFFSTMDRYNVPVYTWFFPNRPLNIGAALVWILMQFLEFVGFLLIRAWVSWWSVNSVVDTTKDKSHNWTGAEILLVRLTVVFGPMALGAVMYDYYNIYSSFYNGVSFRDLSVFHNIMFAFVLPVCLIFMQEGAYFMNEQTREMLHIMDDIIHYTDNKAGIELKLPRELLQTKNLQTAVNFYTQGWVYMPWHPDIVNWPASIEANPEMSTGWLRVSTEDESRLLTPVLRNALSRALEVN